MRQFSESVTDVMQYIVQCEMFGKVDEDSHLYSTYLDLKDMLWQVKDEEDTLDEETQTLIPKYKFDEPLKKLDLPDYDVDMDREMWDN
jgi:hypothetical protein